MTTKTTFSINGKTITKAFQDLFESFRHARLKVSSKADQEYINISLLLAVIIGLIFPVAFVVLIILTLVCNLQVAILQEEKQNAAKQKLIELE
ncbi:DUF4342 domain-containing protein [Sphingobacterium thalpophilum]|uniref:DUF4342 domain-containing protein n=1 Tax=Sphingobacterium thalpophilum TaxID=259 RepID=A0A4U9UNQ1_9SPHI|nr:DUF4342 domain-containing protein [Sphingobacterium thalpophilum]VTR33809.1 Uncharacterised protein [Sphingobacterium thalpophilum]